ncbi:hypothetical protein D3C81_2255530 [compost metagenome]
MMQALKREDAEEFTKQASLNKGFRPLAQSAFDYAEQGVISVEEVLRLVETVDVSG